MRSCSSDDAAPLSKRDVTRAIKSQWTMIASVLVTVTAIAASGYKLLLPSVLNDMRGEWQKDDERSRAAITESVAREFAAIREQLREIKDTSKETSARFDAKLDRLSERIK